METPQGYSHVPPKFKLTTVHQIRRLCGDHDLINITMHSGTGDITIVQSRCDGREEMTLNLEQAKLLSKVLQDLTNDNDGWE